MKISYCTKRNASGWRKKLIIDTDKKQFSRESAHWFCREDFAEVTTGDFRRMLEKVEREGFTQVDFLTP